MPDGESALVLLAQLDAEQQRLRDLLSGRDEASLAQRPPSGKWSVLENVRHLIFAEQSHLGRFDPHGREWSALGLPPTGMQDQKQLRMMSTTTASGIVEVLDAWQAVHAITREHLQQDTPQLRIELDRNLRHLRAHIRVIERLLRTTR